jgi:CRP-like cAMP-binding protein
MISVRETNSLMTGKDILSMRVARMLFGRNLSSRVSSDELHILNQAQWSLRTLDSGVTLFDQGDDCQSVTVLISGWALRQQNLPDGKRQILDFVLPGSLLGFSSSARNSYGIETVTPCVVVSLPLRQFYTLLSRVPALAIRVAEIVAESEVRAYTHVTNLGRRSAKERVASFIVQMMQRMADIGSHSSPYQFELPITQVAIADALGLSNEHVCRTLSKLTADGRIRMKGHRITVLDPKALMRDACIDLTSAMSLENSAEIEAALAA